MGPLTGLRVLDIATILAAPSAATLLGDWGAEVVKLEIPAGPDGRGGDGMRGFPPLKDGKPLWWKVTNRGKKFGTLDLRKPEGVELLKRILPEFDVLVENFRPGTLDRWGLDKETLWAVQPRLVILRVTGFGQTGPYRDRPGFARIFEAMGGLAYITGEPDGEPMHNGFPVGDAIGGLFGAASVLAALWKRARDPEAPGEEIDLALTEATLKILDFLVVEHDQLGVVRERSGNANQYSAPAAVYGSKDGGWVTLAGSTQATWINNCRSIGRPDLIDDPRFASNPDRVANAAELNGIFAAWCAEHDLAEILEAFEREGGTLAPIYSAAQIAADPQFAAREAIVDVPDADFGSVRMQNVVPRFANDPCGIERSAGANGADNDAVWGGMAGLDPNEIARLKALRVI